MEPYKPLFTNSLMITGLPAYHMLKQFGKPALQG
jgi:hypothetical protein